MLTEDIINELEPEKPERNQTSEKKYLKFVRFWMKLSKASVFKRKFSYASHFEEENLQRVRFWIENNQPVRLWIQLFSTCNF